jgi:hypothetical protein
MIFIKKQKLYNLQLDLLDGREEGEAMAKTGDPKGVQHLLIHVLKGMEGVKSILNEDSIVLLKLQGGQE